MGFGVPTFLLTLACSVWLVDAVTLDLALTKELEEVIKKDEFVLSLKHIKPRRRFKGNTETLFSVDFPKSENKFAIVLDRKTKRVTVETLEDGRKRAQHFTVDTLHDESNINSLILDVNQTEPGAHATLYIDCISYGMVATPKSMRDMFSSMKDPQIELYHERKYPMEIHGNRGLRAVLSRNECPLPLDLHAKYDNIFNDDVFNNDLKDDPNVQAQQPDYGYDQRGDIPIVSGLEDIGIINALNALIKAVNTIKGQVESQTATIDELRRILVDCEVCKPRPAPSQRPSCATHPPNCFQGVQCHDTADGPRCGSCPRGYIGNGYDCRPGRTCAERPCYPGVECRDTAQGFRCGRCPEGMEGNGEQCQRRNPCEYSPCAPGCVPVWRPRY